MSGIGAQGWRRWSWEKGEIPNTPAALGAVEVEFICRDAVLAQDVYGEVEAREPGSRLWVSPAHAQELIVVLKRARHAPPPESFTAAPAGNAQGPRSFLARLGAAVGLGQ